MSIVDQLTDLQPPCTPLQVKLWLGAPQEEGEESLSNPQRTGEHECGILATACQP